jgi:hypothetical protein
MYFMSSLISCKPLGLLEVIISWPSWLTFLLAHPDSSWFFLAPPGKKATPNELRTKDLVLGVPD